VNGIQCFDAEQTACQTRLVGCQYHPPARLGQAGDGFQTAGQRLPFVRAFDECGAVIVNDAVPVENDKFQAASLEMSATWFIMPCRRASKARRLVRTAGSSAMTMTSLKK